MTWPPMNPLAPVTRTRDGIFRDSDMDEVGLLDAQSMAIRGLTARGQEAYRNPTTCIVHRVVIGGLCKAALSRRTNSTGEANQVHPTIDDHRNYPSIASSSLGIHTQGSCEWTITRMLYTDEFIDVGSRTRPQVRTQTSSKSV